MSLPGNTVSSRVLRFGAVAVSVGRALRHHADRKAGRRRTAHASRTATSQPPRGLSVRLEREKWFRGLLNGGMIDWGLI